MKIICTTFLLLYICQISFGQCYDASIKDFSFTPGQPAIVGENTVFEFTFCNDNDELPEDTAGALRIIMSHSKMSPTDISPTGIQQSVDFFDVLYLEEFKTWQLTQNKVIPTNECITLSTSLLVTGESTSDFPTAGLNINITPSGIMSGSSCFESEDDNLIAFTSAVILVNTNNPTLDTPINVFPNPANSDFLHVNILQTKDPIAYCIHSTSGNKLISSKLRKEENKIDISALVQGVYTLQIRFPSGSKSVKFIVL